jgi:hypothetical protein
VTRLDPGRMLQALLDGEPLETDAVDRVGAALASGGEGYDQAELIEILMRADSSKHLPLVRRFWLESDDPFVVWRSTRALFDWWHEDRTVPANEERLRKVAEGEPWDPDELARDAARRVLGWS